MRLIHFLALPKKHMFYANSQQMTSTFTHSECNKYAKSRFENNWKLLWHEMTSQVPSYYESKHP